MSMETTAALQARCDLGTLFAEVESLDRYPAWLDIVPKATAAPSDEGDTGPAHFVTLRANVGPLARSKRLRMVRTVHDDRTVRFERREVDGRDHSSWILDATVSEVDATTSSLSMRLHYGGSLWVPMLDRLLQSTIQSSRTRLAAIVED